MNTAFTLLFYLGRNKAKSGLRSEVTTFLIEIIRLPINPVIQLTLIARNLPVCLIKYRPIDILGHRSVSFCGLVSANVTLY